MPAEAEDRNNEIYALAAAGVSHAALAERYGISRQRVGQIVADLTPATFGYTDTDRARIRARELATLEDLSKRAEAVISNPPLVHSAIGKTVPDPRHPGAYLINESVRVAAIRERRLLSESTRRLTGADLAAAERPGREQANAEADASLARIRAAREAEIAEMNRMKAELAARDRAQLAAATPQPGDNDIADAELVDE